MFWIVDRIEGNIAVIEAGEDIFNVPLSSLPAKTKEGSVIWAELSPEEEEKRREHIKQKMNRLFKE